MPWLSTFAFLLFLTASPCFAAQPESSLTYIPKFKDALKAYTTGFSTLEERYRLTLREVERTYFKEVNTLLLEEPPRPDSKSLFETTQEYRDRLATHRKKVAAIRETNQKAIEEREARGGIRSRVAKEELIWLKDQLRVLTPYAQRIETLQRKGCLLPEESATITIHRPEADAFRFPVTINHKGRLYSYTWDYDDRSQAETIWQSRHSMAVSPIFRPEPDEEGTGIQMILSSFAVKGPESDELVIFDVTAPASFDATTRLARIKADELPAAKILISLSRSVDGPVPGMRFVFISPRQFTMGSAPLTPGRKEDERRHEVRITRPYYIMTTEVTQNQWEKVMGYNPSAFPHCGGDCPVDNVYWQEVMRFTARLNAMHKGKGHFRLPTEAEWEYAARTGREDPWITSGLEPGDYAWYRENAGGAPHAVATRKANLWNLFDMNGNVAEWTADWYGPYPERLVENPKGPLKGYFRISRGGSWFHGADAIRGASRNADNEEDRSGYTGFRLVLDIPPEELKAMGPKTQ